MKNKRGQFEILSLAVIAVVALIILGFLFFSSTFRFLSIGIALIVFAGIVLFNPRVKVSQNTRTFLFIGLIGVGLVVILSSGVLQTTFQGERYVEVPFFATVECERGTTSSFQSNIPSDGDWFFSGSGLPDNTDSWNIMIKTPKEDFFSTDRQLEYYICNSRNFCSNRKIVNVDERKGDLINIGNIDADKFLWIQYQGIRGFFPFGWGPASGATVEVTYQPFKLIRSDSLRGGRQEVNTVGCNVPTSDVSWTRRITDFSGSSNIDEFSGDNKLQPGEIINYISGDIIAVTEGNLQSGGWCIFENGQANIYEIEEITYGSGTTINRVNLENRISIDECCDGETYIGSICENGNFVPIETAECISRSDCGTLEFFATSDDTIGRFACINQKCEIVDQREVECIQNSDCRTNEVCSRNTFTCIQSSDVGGPGEETGEDIEQDLGCKFYESEVTSVELDYGPLYWRAYTPGVEPIRKEVTECKVSNIFNILLIAVIILALGIYAINLANKRNRKRGRKR